MNRLKQIADLGQSVWLDYIRRSLLSGGELKRLMDEDGLTGVTSNPAIFEKAITGSNDYREELEQLGREGLDAKTLYERLALEDIRKASIYFEPVYDITQGRDGYVSLEVSPRLAHDTNATIREATRLWQALERPNVMIKVPATPEGLPAIERLIAQGLNVNVTLLFSKVVYEHVVEAYLRGLEQLVASGGDPSRVASVASFFVSRVDSAVDKALAERADKAEQESEREQAAALTGRIAIANAKLAYERFGELFAGERWRALQEQGARPQRLLWASTSTKNKALSDVLYVEELIGPDTVNTLPPATLDAFRDHGKARPSLTEDLDGAEADLAALARLGIHLGDITEALLADGVRKFADAFDKLLGAVERVRRESRGSAITRVSQSLPPELETAVAETVERWQTEALPRRLWARDASLWTGGDENRWLGWLRIVDEQLENVADLGALAEDTAGFGHALLLGMGGSSLCPEVLSLSFGKQEGHPELHVLDSTDPARIRDLESRVDLSDCLVFVSSKSGTTTEPNVLLSYFFERVKEAVGEQEVGRRFIAITDPGSRLEALASERGFRHVLHGLPSIGGRYSALSHFGMAPAAVMGLDTHRFLDRTDEMVEASAACVPAGENPGVRLGAVLGTAALDGRDKLTLVTSPGIADLAAWIEQLVAESTGKQGKGIIPVAGERLAPAEHYGEDRLFVYLRLESSPDAAQDETVESLEQAGQPVVRIAVADTYDLGQEFFRWELATAVAGSILGINPFDQPDVEASKIETRKLLEDYEKTGRLAPETPILEADGLVLYTDPRNARELNEAAGGDGSVTAMLRAHFARLGPGDYLALLAYLEMSPQNDEPLQAMRHAVRDARRVATCLGYGPRFLHSTGQVYKGGPDSGVFLQLTDDDAQELAIPDHSYGFGVVKAAQARGDFQVLADRERRALRVHLPQPVAGSLARLAELVRIALG